MFEESVSSIPSIWASMYSWFTPAVLFVLLNVMIGTIAFTSTLANQKHHHQQQQQNQQQSQSDAQQPKLDRSVSVLQRLRSINFYGYRSQEPQPLSSNFKHTSDSDHHYNLEQDHEHQSFETHSQYLFEQPHPHQEKQTTFYEHPQDTQTQYYFEEINQEKTEELETHIDFQQPRDEKAEENEAGFDLLQAQKENDENEELQSLDEVYSQFAEHHVSRSKSDTKPVAGEIPSRLPAKMRKSASMKSDFKHFEEEDILEARRPATVKERGARVTEADAEVDAKADDFINKFKQQLKLQRLDSIVRNKEMRGRGTGR